MKIKPELKSKLTHVDDYINTHGGDSYARWILMHMRLPAMMKLDFQQFIEGKRLFCTWRRKRYRVASASRFGDIGLSKNLDSDDIGYHERVSIDECSDWGAEP